MRSAGEFRAELAGECGGVGVGVSEGGGGRGMLLPMAGERGGSMWAFVVERVLARLDVPLLARYVEVVRGWMDCGAILELWGQVVGVGEGKGQGKAEGEEVVRAVYVASVLETVDRLWPWLGREMGPMMQVLERYGKAGWGGNGERRGKGLMG